MWSENTYKWGYCWSQNSHKFYLYYSFLDFLNISKNSFQHSGLIHDFLNLENILDDLETLQFTFISKSILRQPEPNLIMGEHFPPLSLSSHMRWGKVYLYALSKFNLGPVLHLAWSRKLFWKLLFSYYLLCWFKS